MGTAGWFTLALFALVLGMVALRLNAQNTAATGRAPRPAARGHARERRRWAAAMEWEFVDGDPVLTTRWRYGTVHLGGPGTARFLVTGSVLTDEGRRMVYVFDHEQAGRVTTTVAAVQRRSTLAGAVELRMPSAPVPDDAGLESVESVGRRYAFATDAELIKPMITPRLVRATDAIGEEAELLWAEDAWVLATAPLSTPPDQLQDLLDHLVEVAAALDASARSEPAGSAGAAPADGTRAGARNSRESVRARGDGESARERSGGESARERSGGEPAREQGGGEPVREYDSADREWR